MPPAMEAELHRQRMLLTLHAAAAHNRPDLDLTKLRQALDPDAVPPAARPADFDNRFAVVRFHNRTSGGVPMWLPLTPDDASPLGLVKHVSAGVGYLGGYRGSKLKAKADTEVAIHHLNDTIRSCHAIMNEMAATGRLRKLQQDSKGVLEHLGLPGYDFFRGEQYTGLGPQRERLAEARADLREATDELQAVLNTALPAEPLNNGTPVWSEVGVRNPLAAVERSLNAIVNADATGFFASTPAGALWQRLYIFVHVISVAYLWDGLEDVPVHMRGIKSLFYGRFTPTVWGAREKARQFLVTSVLFYEIWVFLTVARLRALWPDNGSDVTSAIKVSQAFTFILLTTVVADKRRRSAWVYVQHLLRFRNNEAARAAVVGPPAADPPFGDGEAFAVVSLKAVAWLTMMTAPGWQGNTGKTARALPTRVWNVASSPGKLAVSEDSIVGDLANVRVVGALIFHPFHDKLRKEDRALYDEVMADLGELGRGEPPPARRLQGTLWTVAFMTVKHQSEIKNFAHFAVTVEPPLVKVAGPDIALPEVEVEEVVEEEGVAPSPSPSPSPPSPPPSPGDKRPASVLESPDEPPRRRPTTVQPRNILPESGIDPYAPTGEDFENLQAFEDFVDMPAPAPPPPGLEWIRTLDVNKLEGERDFVAGQLSDDERLLADLAAEHSNTAAELATLNRDAALDLDSIPVDNEEWERERETSDVLANEQRRLEERMDEVRARMARNREVLAATDARLRALAEADVPPSPSLEGDIEARMAALRPVIEAAHDITANRLDEALALAQQDLEMVQMEVRAKAAENAGLSELLRDAPDRRDRLSTLLAHQGVYDAIVVRTDRGGGGRSPPNTSAAAHVLALEDALAIAPLVTRREARGELCRAAEDSAAVLVRDARVEGRYKHLEAALRRSGDEDREFANLGRGQSARQARLHAAVAVPGAVGQLRLRERAANAGNLALDSHTMQALTFILKHDQDMRALFLGAVVGDIMTDVAADAERAFASRVGAAASAGAAKSEEAWERLATIGRGRRRLLAAAGSVNAYVGDKVNEAVPGWRNVTALLYDAFEMGDPHDGEEGRLQARAAARAATDVLASGDAVSAAAKQTPGVRATLALRMLGLGRATGYSGASEAIAALQRALDLVEN